MLLLGGDSLGVEIFSEKFFRSGGVDLSHSNNNGTMIYLYKLRYHIF